MELKEMNLEQLVQLVNDKFYKMKEIAKEIGISPNDLSKQFKEAGWEFNFPKQMYEKVNNEIAVTIEEDNIEEIKQSNTIDEIDDILSLFDDNIKKYVPISTNLRSDINEALNKFGKQKGRGSKQELINKLLEMALTKSGHL